MGGFAFGKQHFLYFNPLPQLQGAFRPSFRGRFLIFIILRFPLIQILLELARSTLVDFPHDFFRPVDRLRNRRNSRQRVRTAIVLSHQKHALAARIR